MSVFKELAKIKELYKEGRNIIDYVKNQSESKSNSEEAIKISYDLQAGSYIKFSEENPDYINNYSQAIADVLNKLGDFSSIIEIGVGEATTLGNVTPKLNIIPKGIYGFDISWSRIKFAQSYLKKKGISGSLFLGNLFESPIQDNSIEIVYTSHSIEPNGGKEREALKELYRITKKYLILLEPSFELADEKGKERMNRLGYVKNLPGIAKELGYKIIEQRAFDLSANPLNPTCLIVIEKNTSDSSVIDNPLACPITKAPLKLSKTSFFCEESLLAYPIIEGVPCLVSENAIIATHYSDFA